MKLFIPLFGSTNRSWQYPNYGHYAELGIMSSCYSNPYAKFATKQEAGRKAKREQRNGAEIAGNTLVVETTISNSLQKLQEAEEGAS